MMEQNDEIPISLVGFKNIKKLYDKGSCLIVFSWRSNICIFNP